ncbi:MAG: DUF1385 domain-containing protein, partial [Bacteroidota bacterium]|nr:DUF1385 domain-containing protein [Bacteroidota bacterium]
VIEGVMMRAKNIIATAVRRHDGEIVVKREEFHSLLERYRWLNIPILRGAIGLVEMMYIGIRTLNYSAEIALAGAGTAPGGVVQQGGDSTNMKAREKKAVFPLVITLIVSLALGVGIFFFFPLFIATRLFSVEQQPLVFNLIAGGIRIAILLLYLYGISLMKDVHRLFQYHGAEHKAVFTFEQNDLLEIPTAMRYTRFHPRCGTSFVLIVMLLAIFLFSFLDLITLQFIHPLSLPIRLLTHLPFIPVVGGIAYELLKFSARRSTTRFGRILVAPGLWLQKITTKEPDESQMEVSLAAMKAALRADAGLRSAAAG